jgi:hypothetical protein
MIRTSVDSTLRYEPISTARKVLEQVVSDDAPAMDYSAVDSVGQFADLPAVTRSGPRRSVVLVLSENHSISPDVLVNGLRLSADQQVDVLVACAGQPADLSVLQRCVGDAQFLLAPAGTSAEDLRELAMAQAAGDIVTLLTAPLISDAALAEPLSKGS